MMRTTILCLAALLALSACENYTPNPKNATYDPVAGVVVPPHPCPDWSQSQTHNFLNETHSNFGCAVNTDTSLQLADPEDLVRGHGGRGRPDTGISTHVIEQYRAGTLPLALTPLQPTSSGSASQ